MQDISSLSSMGMKRADSDEYPERSIASAAAGPRAAEYYHKLNLNSEEAISKSESQAHAKFIADAQSSRPMAI